MGQFGLTSVNVDFGKCDFGETGIGEMHFWRDVLSKRCVFGEMVCGEMVRR
jgi:hypothetical protein